MLKARYCPYRLLFKKPAKTSRAVMNYKDTFFVEVFDSESPEIHGIGEVAIFNGLSVEDSDDFEGTLKEFCKQFDATKLNDKLPSSIRFGFETALSDMQNGGVEKPFSADSNFSISINGLVWMADKSTMLNEVADRINAGFRCIKLKIGGIAFEEEVEILGAIRSRFSSDDIEIRLDANGSFRYDDALRKLDILSKFSIHSIEQPIRQGHHERMAEICRKSPIPIALDEELIGITSDKQKFHMLDIIKPSYIILKPSLCGGFNESEKWIATAEKLGIGWWATSALESNVGLNAIARWLLKFDPSMPQGLGTGSLYTNNIESPMSVSNGMLNYNSNSKWDLSAINF